MSGHWFSWADTGPGSPLNSLCSPDLTLPDFWRNDLGRFTPCFIDLAVLGLAHLIAGVIVCVQLARAHSPAFSRYRLIGVASVVQVLHIILAASCALVPILELNGRLGQAAGGSETGPAPHEFTAAALATCSWALLAVLFGVETQGKYVVSGRWSVRFGVVLATSSELVKLRIIVAAQPVPEYFLWLYVTYVSMQCILSLLALLWWPHPSQLVMESEGYSVLPGGVDRQQAAKPGHPESRAGVVSSLTFAWLSQLMSTGYKSTLARQQVPELPPHDRVDTVTREFDRHWHAELQKPGKPSLGTACWKTVRPLFIYALPCKLLIDLSQFVGPVFLNRLLNVVADKSAPAWEGYMYAGIMFAGTLIGSVADHQHFHLVMRAGSRLSAVLGAKVAAQVLRLAPSSRSHFSTGRIYSSIASDAEQLSSLCSNIFALMSAPLRITGAMYLLYVQLGVSSFATLLCLLVMIPINVVMVRWSGVLLKSALVHTDERTKLEGELVGGIEVVKCSAWERPFLERIMQFRAKELATLWRLSAISAAQGFVIFSIPTIVPVVTFSAYLLLGNSLSSAKAFTALALFNVLRFPVFLLPQMLQIITQARVSLNRIQDILVADTLQEQAPLPPAKQGEAAVVLRGDFSWDAEGKGVPSLANVDLTVPAGQLVAVVGATGSGKTTLLSAMLRQMQQVYGDAPIIRGRVAYVPQAAFIINATVRDNILFGQTFEAAKYERCIVAACLDTDLRLLAGGDMTELGDKGVNLSGGQRQRVSIARALYSDADVILLDDPLSALDSKVGRKVFEVAIKGELLRRGRTVILATNQLQFVQDADQVLFMSGGKVAEQGRFQALMSAGGQFAGMMKEVQVEQESDEQDKDKSSAAGEAALAVTSGAVQSNKSAPGAQLASEEKVAQGSVSLDVLFSYIGFMGGLLVFLYLLSSFVMVEVLRVCTNVWLSWWTGSTDSQDAGGKSPMFYLEVFAAVSAVQLLAQLLNMLEMPRLCLKAADGIHRQLVNNLVVAPMSFFHTTPLGRVVNRLTKDTSDVDRQLAGNTGMAVRNMLQVISCIALVGWIAPLALPSMVAIMLAFWLLYQYYQATLRQVKRLEAVSRSPVFTSVTEIITGCATIQAFGSGPRLIQRHWQLIDASMANTFICNSLSRWLGVRLEALGNLCTLMAAVVAVEQRGGASSAGLVLSYAMQMTILMSMVLRSTSVVENNFNSVERVIEYTALPVEGGKPDDRGRGSSGTVAKQSGAPPNWPNEGVVEFKQVAMRYRPGLPLVLRGVSFKAAANEKVGIVGRTGAGKSSMIGCLFRLTEVEGGAIEIDGVNISKIPLHKLRSSMALIPQVPVLFTGTIRLNLSPFGLHNDAELWNVLRRAHLAAVVEAWPAGLDTLLQEGGAPLSAGQKQLLALARAQLNTAKVLVLDEATANVDVETDALIQKTMRSEFKDRTMLAIAHRLHTIIDYDKVLVLDRGLVAEFGSPKELLSQPNGTFTSMVNDTGDATAKFLKAVASGKVDLQASIAEAAEEGMEKLCTPLAANDPALAPLLNAGLTSGVLLQSLASQLLERSQAVIKKVKEVSKDLSRNAEEDADSFAAEGLLDSLAAAGPAASHSLTSAQRSMLQALELLAQVEQYARAAETIAKAQSAQTEAGSNMPANLADLRQMSVGRCEAAKAAKCPARSCEQDDIRTVLNELLQRPISMPVHGGDAAAAASSSTAAAVARPGDVHALARRASEMLRASSLRESKKDNAPQPH